MRGDDDQCVHFLREKLVANQCKTFNCVPQVSPQQRKQQQEEEEEEEQQQQQQGKQVGNWQISRSLASGEGMAEVGGWHPPE